jgi:hypothetical protein
MRLVEERVYSIYGVEEWGKSARVGICEGNYQ